MMQKRNKRPRPDKANGEEASWRWKVGSFEIGWGLLAKLSLAAVGAILAAIFAFVKEDLGVRAVSLFIKGPLDAEWLMASYTFADAPLTGYAETCERVRLHQFLYRVIGESTGTRRSWTLNGYYNQPFLALSNVSAGGGSGAGTFIGRRDEQGNFAFVGEKISVHCKEIGRQPVLLRCPAILVRADSQQYIFKNRQHLIPQRCMEVASEGADARVCTPPAEPHKPREMC